MRNLDISSISLIDVIIDHFDNYSETSFQKSGKNIYSTKCPLHHEIRGNSFTIYDKDGKWDWCCFGSCNTGGNAAKLLSMAFPEKYPTPEKAAEYLRERYNLKLPETVTLETFSSFKQIDQEFLKAQGIEEVENGITIPFYDIDGTIMAVKKRMKFTGKPKYIFTQGRNTIYGLREVKDYSPEYILLLEGETDTLTARYCGLQAVGIPGATAWQSDWLHYFSKFDKVIVVPDRDQAGSNLYNKLKVDFNTRLYVIPLPSKAKDLSEHYVYLLNGDKEALASYYNPDNAVPATLEGFLEAISDKDKMKKIINNPVAWDCAVSNLTNPIEESMFVEEIMQAIGKHTRLGKRVIQKAISMAKTRLHQLEVAAASEDDENVTVFIENNGYYKWKSTPAGPVKHQITNFIVKLHHTLYRDGECYRVCTLHGDYGATSAPIILDGEALSNPQKFNTVCISKGDFMFDGNMADLNSIRKLILSQENPTVIQPNYIGHIDGKWLLGDIGIDSQGNIVEADEYGILKLDDKYYACPPQITPPYFPDIEPVTPEYRRDVAYTLLKNIGGYEAWIALGWAVAGWHSDNIFKHGMENSYPILFIHGKHNSGKTWLARWLMKQYGFGRDDSQENGLESSTLTAMSNKLANYASLPVWWDDYRNTIRDITARGDRLLLAYNRSGRERSHRTNGMNEVFPVRAFVLLSGEHIPDSKLNALQTRCVFIQLSAYMRDDSYTAKMQELVTKFHCLGLHFAVKMQREGSQELLDIITELTNLLMESGCDARIARCHSIMAAGFIYGYRDVVDKEDIDKFIEWLVEYTKQEKQANEEDTIVHRFLLDLTTLMENGTIKHGTHYVVTDEYLHIHNTQVYEAWRKHVIDLRGNIVEWRVLLDYLKKEPWCVTNKLVRYPGLGNKPVKGTMFKLDTLPCEELVTQCEVVLSTGEDEPEF